MGIFQRFNIMALPLNLLTPSARKKQSPSPQQLMNIVPSDSMIYMAGLLSAKDFTVKVIIPFTCQIILTLLMEYT